MIKITDKIFEVSLDIICVIDKEGIFKKVSSSSFKHWGYTPKELEGTSYFNLLHPEDLESTKLSADRIYLGSKVTLFENRYIKKNGEIAYNDWSAAFDDESQLMYCVARDAKEKMDKEELMLLNEQRFKALVQEGADLIGILDAEGNYKYVSPTSFDILGIAPEDFLGRNALEFIHPEDRERTFSCLIKIGEQPRVLVEPFRFQNKDGEWRWIETVLTDMTDHPLIKGIVANSRDITDQREKLSNFAWKQSHFMRAPLARMLGLLNLMEIDSYQSDEIPILMSHFKNSLLEMDEIIKEIVEETQQFKIKKP